VVVKAQARARELKPTIEHLSDVDCRKMLAELVSCVQALGPLSSTDVTSELISTLEKHGVEWDHDKVPEYSVNTPVCLCAAHTQRGIIIKPGLKKSRVMWDDDHSKEWVSNDDIEEYQFNE
jgi:hypothetical protein